MKNRILPVALILTCMTAGLAGCGNETAVMNPEDVQLLDPVGVALNYELAARRDLYDAKVYSAIVCPKVEEYKLESSISFAGYDALPGESVNKGDTLLHGDTKNIDEQIKNMEKEIKQMEEDHLEYIEDNKESLKQPLEDRKVNYDIVQNLEKNRQEPYLVGEDGESQVENPNYAQWAQDYKKYDGLYRSANQKVMELEEALKQHTELYELDHAYKLTQLGYLKEDRKKLTLTAGMDGEVAALRFLDSGNWLGSDSVLMAVGDTSRKELRSEFVNKGEINRASDVYCIVNGKRHEVEYEPIDSDEYKRLEEQNGKVYSTFYLKDAADEINVGDYAAIVVVKRKTENVIAVPKDSVRKDETGNYVYLVDGNDSVYTPVKTGVTDGVYTEIVSGLQEGDKVLTESAVAAGDKTVKVTKGSVSASFSGTGFLGYPSAEWIKNPVEYGTCYFVEKLVSQYQQVKKGDVLATVRVVPDQIELERNKIKLQRETERLADLQKQYKENESKYLLKQIEAKEEYIQEIRKTISEMEASFATKEIKAPKNGIITYVADYKAEDLIQKDANVFEIADENLSYLFVEDKNGQLTYGNQAEIAYEDANGQSRVATGTVVSLNQMAVSRDLLNEYVLIMIPADEIADMAGSTSENGWWFRNHFKVTVPIRTMENVLVIPRKAVKDNNGITYVKVKQADGQIVYKSFIAGGSDNTNYWVAEGLTEGMELCLE